MVSQPSPFRVPDLQPLLAPRSIAVVGASDRPGAGSIVLDNLRMLGYPGSVYPVNPKYTGAGGMAVLRLARGCTRACRQRGHPAFEPPGADRSSAGGFHRSALRLGPRQRFRRSRG